MSKDTRVGVFAPVDHRTGARLRWNWEDVEILSGSLDRLPYAGLRGRVRVDGATYRVYQAGCGLPHCLCDATVKRERPDGRLER